MNGKYYNILDIYETVIMKQKKDKQVVSKVKISVSIKF